MAGKTCNRCGGPDDPLHTTPECDAMLRLQQYDKLDRDQIALVAAVIARAGGGVPAALALHDAGWLRRPQ